MTLCCCCWLARWLVGWLVASSLALARVFVRVLVGGGSVGGGSFAWSMDDCVSYDRPISMDLCKDTTDEAKRRVARFTGDNQLGRVQRVVTFDDLGFIEQPRKLLWISSSVLEPVATPLVCLFVPRRRRRHSPHHVASILEDGCARWQDPAHEELHARHADGRASPQLARVPKQRPDGSVWCERAEGKDG